MGLVEVPIKVFMQLKEINVQIGYELPPLQCIAIRGILQVFLRTIGPPSFVHDIYTGQQQLENDDDDNESTHLRRFGRDDFKTVSLALRIVWGLALTVSHLLGQAFVQGAVGVFDHALDVGEMALITS